MFMPLFTSGKQASQPSLLTTTLPDSCESLPARKRSTLEKDERIQEITTLLSQQNMSRELLAPENINAALECNYSNGNIQKAMELLLAVNDAMEGKVLPISNSTGVSGERQYYKLQGADNRNMVTCYLDALLFAMFSRLESFEPMIQRPLPNHTGTTAFDTDKENLSVILRLYVNLLRSGKLITTDITKILLGSILKTGWDESCFYRQQDCCDLFTFITDKLGMPMITLKLDIAHEGKEDKQDDHKLVNERLLLVSVPQGDGPILLEQCLEQYFANSIQVSRQLERRRTLSISQKNPQFTSTKSTRRVSVCLHSPDLISTTQLHKTLSNATVEQTVILGQDPEDDDNESIQLKYQRYAPLRSPSIADSASASDRPPAYNTICEPTISWPEKPPLAPSPSANNALWNKSMEITLPAWMFLQLVPFYTNTCDHPSAASSTQSLPIPHATEKFATTRPVLGICLKRSEWSADHATLNKRQVMVPSVIHFPSFVADDEEDSDSSGLNASKYVLVLESAIFHRGTSTDSGHFIALAKENDEIRYHEDRPNATTTTTASDTDASDNNETQNMESSEATHDDNDLHPRWLLFDDLLPAGEKVQVVDYNQVFQDEHPYILFYRLVTVQDFENEGERHKVSAGLVDQTLSKNASTESLVKETDSPPSLVNGDSTSSSESSGSVSDKSFFKVKPSLGQRTKSAFVVPTKFTRSTNDDPSISRVSRSPSPVTQVRRSLDEVSIHRHEMQHDKQLPKDDFLKFKRNRTFRSRSKHKFTDDDYRDEKCIIS